MSDVTPERIDLINIEDAVGTKIIPSSFNNFVIRCLNNSLIVHIVN